MAHLGIYLDLFGSKKVVVNILFGFALSLGYSVCLSSRFKLAWEGPNSIQTVVKAFDKTNVEEGEDSRQDNNFDFHSV